MSKKITITLDLSKFELEFQKALDGASRDLVWDLLEEIMLPTSTVKDIEAALAKAVHGKLKDPKFVAALLAKKINK